MSLRPLVDSSSVNVFKKNVFSIIRPPAKSVYGIHDLKGVAYLTQLRVGMSKLNCHKFKHNFKDTNNPMCQVNDGIEDTEHFFLLCNSFQEQRHTLLPGVNDVLAAYEYSVSSNSDMLEVLLYGSKHLSLEANNLILRLTTKYIFETERFA